MESTADKIVAEVKSQGVFDQFRKDSIATIDTKPAYINLIQRVQSTVHNFLASKKWSPETNKIQMRERLRRHITESSFLELGIERIVDQVVNPKISTTFQPQIENIAYVALGIDKPKPKVEEQNRSTQNSVSVMIPNGNLMPEELEQISPDSDKMTIKSDSHNSKGSDTMDTSDDKTEDFESPEFEPIENNSNDNLEEQKPLMIKTEEKVETKTENDNDKGDVTQESNLSQVSSLSIVSESEDTNLHASISEEAQMPKFNENSNSLTEPTTKTSNFAELAFNIKKDEIKFEGTERKIKVESPENFPDEKPEEKIIVEETKVKTERNGNDSSIVDSVSVIKFHKEKSRDHHQSSSSSHKKSSSNRDRERDRDRRSDRSDKDRKHYSSSSSYKKSSGHSSSKDRHSSSSSSKSKSKSTEKSLSSRDKHRNDKCSSKPSVFRRKSTDSNDDNAGFEKKSSNLASNGNQTKDTSCVEDIKPSGGTSDSTSPSDNASLPTVNNANLPVSDNVNMSVDSPQSNNLQVPDLTVPEISNLPVSENVEISQSDTDLVSLPVGSSDNSASDTDNALVPDLVSLPISATDNSTASDSTTLFESTMDNLACDADTLQVSVMNNLSGSDTPTSQVSEDDSPALDTPISQAAEINFPASDTSISQVTETNCSYEGLTNDDELPLYYFDAPISMPLDEDFELEDSKLIRFAKVVMHDAMSISSYRSTESVCSTSSLKRKLEPEPETVTETKATLIIDCVDYANYEYAHKKFKSSLNKVSPTPSELSVGSKENECVKKEMGSGLRKPAERKSIVSNQRYSSEDLYKPRPVLSQRSRRRGIDNNVL